MKYPAKFYARAFAEAAFGDIPEEQQKKLVRNLVAAAKKNGDHGALPKILAAAEKMLREKEGLRKLTIETARPLSEKLMKQLHGLAEKTDIVEEKVEPKLVAGVRLTLNDEKQFDATLEKQLLKMFAG